MKVLACVMVLVLSACQGNPSNNATVKNVAGDQEGATLTALTAADAQEFVTSWCGSGVLTNVRTLDADKYLVSADMPAWLNVEKTNNFDTDQEEFISELKASRLFNAMFPTGKMILADFSSGSGCRNTQVAIDALAAAYLKKLQDASSSNALTCERKSKGNYHRLVIKVPVLESFGYTDEEVKGRCSTILAHALVGHSSGTLTVSEVSNYNLQVSPTLLDFALRSFTLEADGSQQFIREDGALKFFYSDFISRYHGEGHGESYTMPGPAAPPLPPAK